MTLLKAYLGQRPTAGQVDGHQRPTAGGERSQLLLGPLTTDVSSRQKWARARRASADYVTALIDADASVTRG